MQPEEVLGLTAGVIQVFAYWDYNRQVARGNTSPNGATWAVWAGIAFLCAGSYFFTTGKWFLVVPSIVNSIFCVWTFVSAFRSGKFEKLDFWDKGALLVGLLAAVVWIMFRSAVLANLILQVAILCGFVPTYRLVRRNPTAEVFRPWFIWAGTYVVLTAAVILSWKGQWVDLVYPVNSIILHLLVPGIAMLAYLYLPDEEDLFLLDDEV